jgi:hypothetical protein
MHQSDNFVSAKTWQDGESTNRMRFILGIFVLWVFASPVVALTQNSAGEGAGFTCSASFGSCTCDGTYEQCNAMEKSCKDQKIACTKINDQRICTCFMATKPNL